MKTIRALLIASLAAFSISSAVAQTSGGITRSGTVNPNDLAIFKNGSQIQKVAGTPLNTQCLVYSGTYPNGTWGPGACVAGGAGTVTSVTATAGAGIALSGTCTSISVFSCTFALDPLASVISFNGRFGSVVPANNDYNFTNLAGSIAIGQIPNSLITLAKIANGTALSVLGRSANSAGAYADINCVAASDAVVRESGSTIGCGTIATGGIANLAVTNAKLAAGAAAANLGSAGGDLTGTYPSPTIIANGVTYAKFQQAATGNVVLANATSGAANYAAYAMPSCSSGGVSLKWLTNTGFQCYTISATDITTGILPTANGGTGVASPAVGSLPVNNGSSPQTNIASVASGNCFVSNGVGSAPIAASGCWRLLNTLTASNSASLSDTTSLTSAFTAYEIVFEDFLPATASTTCQLQVQNSGSFQATNYVTSVQFNSGTSSGQAQSTTYIPCNVPTVGSTTVPMTATLRLNGLPSGTSVQKLWTGTMTTPNSGVTFVYTGTMGAVWNNLGAITGFQVTMSSGNITSGKIKIFGRL